MIAAIACPEARPVLFAATPLGRMIAPLFPFNCNGFVMETCSMYVPGQIWILSPADAALTAS
jgi:hypothetical protein